jgi:TRAP-type C4-dicarboxylate transport system permease small subunit
MIMRRIIIYISQTIDRVCQVSSAFFFAAMLILVLFQVAARYIFQAAPAWTAEVSRYCMVWGGLLGATVAFKAEAEPRIIEPPAKNHRVRAGFALWIRALAVTIFLGPVLYYSPGFLARTLHRTTEALGISTLWVSMAVPLAVAVIFWHLLAKLVAFGIDQQAEN